MGQFNFKLPDLGEGIVEAELAAWHVSVGDVVEEGDLFADIMTDKATVEVPAPVDGTVTKLVGAAGDMLVVGSVFAMFEVEGDGNSAQSEEAAKPAADTKAPDVEKLSVSSPRSNPTKRTTQGPASSGSMGHSGGHSGGLHGTRAIGEKPVASPAVRGRAKELGIDLRFLPSSGPAGKITHDDLDVFIENGGQVAIHAAAPAQKEKQPFPPQEGAEAIKVIGLRRVIAEKLQIAKQQIPHITYVEEIDVTAVEALRAKMNASRSGDQPKLTFLPFLMGALVQALQELPKCNAVYDDDAGIVYQHPQIHIGVAAQTDKGLMVPVVRNAESRDAWSAMAEMLRVSTAAKDGTATREELSGSTITISSLGRLGGVVSTPVINKPEVAIIGVNNMVERPMVRDGEVVIRKMMNLSSSFDHRIIDGYDAAELIQYIKTLLEDPSSIFAG